VRRLQKEVPIWPQGCGWRKAFPFNAGSSRTRYLHRNFGHRAAVTKPLEPYNSIACNWHRWGLSKLRDGCNWIKIIEKFTGIADW